MNKTYKANKNHGFLKEGLKIESVPNHGYCVFVNSGKLNMTVHKIDWSDSPTNKPEWYDEVVEDKLEGMYEDGLDTMYNKADVAFTTKTYKANKNHPFLKGIVKKDESQWKFHTVDGIWYWLTPKHSPERQPEWYDVVVEEADILEEMYEDGLDELLEYEKPQTELKMGNGDKEYFSATNIKVDKNNNICVDFVTLQEEPTVSDDEVEKTFEDLFDYLKELNDAHLKQQRDLVRKFIYQRTIRGR